MRSKNIVFTVAMRIYCCSCCSLNFMLRDFSSVTFSTRREPSGQNCPRLVMIIHSLAGLACDDSTQVNLISGRFVHSCKLLLIVHNDGEDCWLALHFSLNHFVQSSTWLAVLSICCSWSYFQNTVYFLVVLSPENDTWLMQRRTKQRWFWIQERVHCCCS